MRCFFRSSMSTVSMVFLLCLITPTADSAQPVADDASEQSASSGRRTDVPFGGGEQTIKFTNDMLFTTADGQAACKVQATFKFLYLICSIRNANRIRKNGTLALPQRPWLKRKPTQRQANCEPTTRKQ